MHEKQRFRETDEVERLREEVAQLQTALDSRVVIEQAKGVLAERYDLSIAEAFALLRYAARSSRMPLRELAEDVAARTGTPAALTRALAKSQRLHAAGQRERAEAEREQAGLQRRRAQALLETIEAGQTRPD